MVGLLQDTIDVENTSEWRHAGSEGGSDLDASSSRWTSGVIA